MLKILLILQIDFKKGPCQGIPQDGIHELFEKSGSGHGKHRRCVDKSAGRTGCRPGMGPLAVGGIRTVFPDHRGLTGQIGIFNHELDENPYKRRCPRSNWL